MSGRGKLKQPKCSKGNGAAKLTEISISNDEREYREKNGDKKVLDYLDYIKCTKCSFDYSSALKTGKEVPIHPILGVIFCNPCSKFYGDGIFSLDEDDEDKYCRWCGEGGTLFICSGCACGFCPKCIKKNLGKDELKEVKNCDDWKCLLCNPKPLWTLRHVAELARVHCQEVTKKNEEAKRARVVRQQKKAGKGSSCLVPDIVLSEGELEYRKKNRDIALTDLLKKAKCTKCNRDLSKSLKTGGKVPLHPVLQVLFCKACSKFYGDGNFSQDEDNEDKYCRWCGEGGTLFICSKCGCGFCPKCIKKHFGNEIVKDVEENSDWNCYLCEPTPLWELRNIAVVASSSTQSQPKRVSTRIERKGSGATIDGSGADAASTRSNTDTEVNMKTNEKEPSSSIKSNEKDGVKLSIAPALDLLKFLRTSTEMFRIRTERLMEEARTVNNDKSLQKFMRKMESLDGALDLMDKVTSKARKIRSGCPISGPDDKLEAGTSAGISASGDGSDAKVKSKGEKSRDRDYNSDNGDGADGCKKSKTSRHKSENSHDSDASSSGENGGNGNGNKPKVKAHTAETSRDSTDSDGVDGSKPTGNDRATENSHDGDVNSSGGDDDADNGGNRKKPEGNGKASARDSDIPHDNDRSSDGGDGAESCNGSESKGKGQAQKSKNSHGSDTINLSGDDEAKNGDNGSKEKESACESDISHGSGSNSDGGDKAESGREKGLDQDRDSVDEVDENGGSQGVTNNDKTAESRERHEQSASPAASGKNSPVLKESGAEKTRGDVREENAVVNISCLSSLDASKEDEGAEAGPLAKAHEESEGKASNSIDSKVGGNAEPSGDEINCGDGDEVVTSQSIKKTVLDSSSEGSEEVEKVGKNSDDSSDCLQRSTRKKRKVLKKTVKKSDRKKASPKVGKTEKSEVDKLTNLKTLIRNVQRDRNAYDASTDEDSQEGKKKNEKKGKKPTKSVEKKTNLLDKINECFAESGSELSDKSDRVASQDFAGFYEENMDLVRKVILATSTDESDSGKEKSTGEKEVKTIEVQKEETHDKKRIRSSDSDSSINRKKPKRRLLSSGISESSDSEGNKKDKEANKLKRKRIITLSSSDGDDFVKDKDDTKKDKSWKRIAKDSSSESDSDIEVVSQKSPAKGRKNIKELLKDTKLEVGTKQAVKDEEERKKRLAEREKLFKKLFGDNPKELILDFNEAGEVLLSVSKRLLKKLKPHQVTGVKFMWDSCFESLSAMETSHGGGCILAHCMGLGKTLQVVTLVHTLLHNDLGVKTVLVVCPLSTVINWVNEFEMWLDVAKCDTIDIYNLNKHKGIRERNHQLKTWHEGGGVMIISYSMFRILIKKPKGIPEMSLIRPGPDLVVCDEGHLLKNEGSVLSKCMNQIQTSRRIVLTGTPLQNNLKEYYCMVQFIKPNILGTNNEFMNRFVNPIENGQFEDSTEFDVRLMKRRSHVLHSLLDGCVQRRDYAVLTPFLPPKHEYVIYIKLSDTLASIYRRYVEDSSVRGGGPSLFKDFQALGRVWTHPISMMSQFERALAQKEAKTDSEEDGFVDDRSESEISRHKASSSGSSSDSSIVCVTDKEASANNRRATRSNPVADDVVEIPQKEEEKPWWNEMITDEQFQDISISGKLVLFFSILEECAAVGDKLLVFSQSLFTLDVLEHFLEKKNNEGEEWEPGINFFRLDGSCSSESRAAWCKAFNRPTNTAAKLFLISTRAGGLGINLFGANRVIIFDASWNPSHDVQSIFRIYRFGQVKPCYVYRFIAEATMEEKIYNRQVTKLSLAHRVVDEHQIERHYSSGNLQELYRFDPIPREEWKIPILPKDEVLAKMLKQHGDIIVKYHEHDSLLENKEGEELSEEERKAAWADYETNLVKKTLPPGGLISNMNLPPEILASMIKQQQLYQMQMMQIQMQMQAQKKSQPAAGGTTAASNSMADAFAYYKANGTMPPTGVFSANPAQPPKNPPRPIEPDVTTIKAMDMKALLSFGFTRQLYRNPGEEIEEFRARILKTLNIT